MSPLGLSVQFVSLQLIEKKNIKKNKKIEFFTFLFHRFMSVVDSAFTLEIYSISPTHNFVYFTSKPLECEGLRTVGDR